MCAVPSIAASASPSIVSGDVSLPSGFTSVGSSHLSAIWFGGQTYSPASKLETFEVPASGSISTSTIAWGAYSKPSGSSATYGGLSYAGFDGDVPEFYPPSDCIAFSFRFRNPGALGVYTLSLSDFQAVVEGNLYNSISAVYTHRSLFSTFYVSLLMSDSTGHVFNFDTRRLETSDAGHTGPVSVDFDCSDYSGDASVLGFSIVPWFESFGSVNVNGAVRGNFGVGYAVTDLVTGVVEPGPVDEINDNVSGILGVLQGIWEIITSPIQWLIGLLIPSLDDLSALLTEITTDWQGRGNLLTDFLSVFVSLFNTVTVALEVDPDLHLVFPGFSYDFGSGPLQILPSFDVAAAYSVAQPVLDILQPVLAVVFSMLAILGVYRLFKNFAFIWFNIPNFRDSGFAGMRNFLKYYFRYIINPISWLAGSDSAAESDFDGDD